MNNLLAIGAHSQLKNLREHLLYLTEGRKPASLPFSALPDDGVEASLRGQWVNVPLWARSTARDRPLGA